MKMDPGFTLVEVLVALVAGALVLAGLTAMLAMLQRQYAGIDFSGGAIVTLEPGLRQWLEQAVPYEVDGVRPVYGPRALRLIVPAPQALQAPGLVQLDLVAARHVDGEALIARLAALPGGSALPADAMRPIVLAEGLQKIRFDVDEAANDDAGPGSPPARLISVGLRANGRWAHIDVVPRLTSDGRCRFDPISQACR